MLAKPLFSEPGTVFDYDNCNTNIFGQIIRKAANKKLDAFAKEYLFDKIGVARQEWQPVRNDVVLCSGDLHLRPRDMAKFGQLFLNRGEWNGERVISSAWCDLSTAALGRMGMGIIGGKGRSSAKPEIRPLILPSAGADR